MANKETILTIVEPTKGGDSTLELAHDAVERGGQANVVMLITDRVRRNIADFARSENISTADAEIYAIDRLAEQCRSRVGGDTTVTTRRRSGDLLSLLTPDTTAIAVPERLLSQRAARKITKRTGIPVVIAPETSTSAA